MEKPTLKHFTSTGQKATQESFNIAPCVMTFYQFFHIPLQHTIQGAECFTLGSEVCNTARGAAQQMLQEVPAHEPWRPLDRGQKECGSFAAGGLA